MNMINAVIIGLLTLAALGEGAKLKEVVAQVKELEDSFYNALTSQNQLNYLHDLELNDLQRNQINDLFPTQTGKRDI